MAFSHPFMASELGSSFVLDRALRMGTVPLVWAAKDPASTLAAYAMLYVREEVMAEGLVRDIRNVRLLSCIEEQNACLWMMFYVFLAMGFCGT